MIVLHQFAPCWGINPSPFCLKVETWLRLAGLPFRTVVDVPFRAPKGKLPFAVLEDGRRIGDSGRIIEALTREHDVRLDDGLSEAQRVRGHLLRRTVEESLYFVLLHARWIDPSGWELVRPAYFGQMPQPARTVVPGLLRRRVGKMLTLQGTGRHDRAEIYALGAADLAAVAASLRETEFAAADRPTSYDATVYAMLVNILRAPLETPLKVEARRHEILDAYLTRVDQALS